MSTTTTENTSLSMVLAGDPLEQIPTTLAPTPGSFDLGVNLSGLEDGAGTANAVAGTSYAVPTLAELQYYHSQGLNLIRLPFAWEQLQPVLNGPLDSTYLGYMQTVVNEAASLGMKVILDAHDSGGYGTDKLGDGTLTDADFANMWSQLAGAFAGNAGIGGYDLMNEPNTMPSATAWQSAAQAAITAIRGVDMATPIYVEGNHYSSAATWTADNAGLQTLADPANNLIFSAHVYLDSDSSGQYFNWNQQSALGVNTDVGPERLQNFVAWLNQYGLKGDIGEIGTANDSPYWLDSLNTTLAYAQQNNLQVTYWAGGPWWGNYPLSVEPTNGDATAQMAVLDNYTGAFATVNNPTVTGSATPDTTITLTDEANNPIGTTTSDANGLWSYTITGLSAGVHTVVASQSVAGADSAVAAVTFNYQPTATVNTAAINLVGTHSQFVIANSGGSLYVQNNETATNPAQTDAGVQVMQFTDGVGVFDASGDAETVAHLYQAAFADAPDISGLQYWANNMAAGMSALTVAQSFAGSPQFLTTYGSLSDSGFVNQMYENVLGRAADTAGLQYWESALATGTSRGAVLLGFSESFENIQNTIGTTGDSEESEAYRLYQAALDRTPDSGGLSYWTQTLQAGVTPQQMAASFLTAPEFTGRYGALSDNDFVNALYQNVLGRAADANGAAYWDSIMAAGTSRASVLLGFSDSIENRADTAAATHANWVYLPNQTA